MRRIALALLLAGCASSSGRVCTQAQLAQVVADCDADMHERCSYDRKGRPDPNCPAVADCKAKLQDWKVCQ